MASTPAETTVSTPWYGRALRWAGFGVLAAGVAIFIGTYFRGGETTPDQPVPPANFRPQQGPVGLKLKDVPLEAQTVARKFIMTAVARKNLGESWTYVHPDLRAGFTLNQWKGGDIPVTPYPLKSLSGTRWSVQEILPRRNPDQVLMEVVLFPKPGSTTRPGTFQVGVKAVGNGADRRWLVDYWMPRWTPPIPHTPN